MESVDIELRKLSPGTVFDISQILENGECWKQLMSIIPSDANGDTPKYNVDHINLIERAGIRDKRACTDILLEEWGTSGQRRPHLSDLLKLLIKAQLFRAAEYVSINLLKQDAPVRPVSGPAALVEIPDVLAIPSALPNSDCGSECQKVTTLCQQNNILKHGSKLQHIHYDILKTSTDCFCEKRKLGTGGFGSVYLCDMNGIKTAVKRLHNSGAAIPGLTEEQFKNELLILEDLSHPNLLPLLAFSSNGPHLCLIYEYMPNGSLQDALECKITKRVLEWHERLNIALGTAKGLEYLHIRENKPLVHRDIKSANILLDENLVAKVGDFGIAKQGTSGKLVTMNTSTVVGTSAYMAPEAFRGDVSAKGDIFSFGVVLLEIITGLPPYINEGDGCDLVSTHLIATELCNGMLFKMGYVCQSILNANSERKFHLQALLRSRVYL